MSEIVIIAGPQAAGKSTSIASISEQCNNMRPMLPGQRFPVIFPLQESRQIIIHKYMLLGAIFMTHEQELEVVECDFSRMDAMIARDGERLVYIDECNIFTIAHALAHGIANLDEYFEGYLERLNQLHAKIIFVDTLPEMSWNRRREKYERRLIYFPRQLHDEIMQQYRDYINMTYRLLMDLYQKIPLPKEMVSPGDTEHETVRNVSAALGRLSDSFVL